MKLCHYDNSYNEHYHSLVTEISLQPSLIEFLCNNQYLNFIPFPERCKLIVILIWNNLHISNLCKNFIVQKFLIFRAHKQILVTVHYELYQGVPLVSKWLSLETNSLVGEDGVQAQISVIEKLCTNWQWSQQGKLSVLKFLMQLLTMSKGIL